MDDLTRGERKEMRKVLAELNAASIHALYIINSLIKQWVWGLDGGHTEDNTHFPELNCDKAGDRKWLRNQAMKIQRHAWDALGLKGYKSGQNIPNGLYRTINAKVNILNDTAAETIPNKKDYRTAIIVQTGVMRLALYDLYTYENHKEPCWRYLMQTLETFCRRFTSPEDWELIEQIHIRVGDIMAGRAALEEWESK